MYDFIIIGAGYAGLSAAALLARDGYQTLLVEAHTTLGGCASFFRRKHFTFDVGATTFSGVLPHQPVGRLFAELGVSPELVKLDPGMIIKLDGREITRHAAPGKWIAEAARHFSGGARQADFWHEIYDLESQAWQLNQDNYHLPPRSFSDLWQLAKPANFLRAPLLRGLFAPLENLLKKHGLESDFLFRRFLDEQLLISTQNDARHTPYLTAAMGLAYPSETYYPTGGMFRPALLIQRTYKAAGGALRFRTKIAALEQRKNYYIARTEDGAELKARAVISSVPLWNLAQMMTGAMRAHYEKLARRFSRAWGAMTVYFAIEDVAELPTAYYQIHTRNRLPFCDSGSMFVSFSLRGDTQKAAGSWRTVTISTHTRAAQWFGISAAHYAEMKAQFERAILAEFDLAFPEFSGTRKEFVACGTPVTFRHFTFRFNGYVGGIPHSLQPNLLQLPANATPFENFYHIGDTAFPGQGTPAVILSALNTVARIREKEKRC